MVVFRGEGRRSAVKFFIVQVTEFLTATLVDQAETARVHLEKDATLSDLVSQGVDVKHWNCGPGDDLTR